MKSGVLTIISGFSGAGKGSLVREVLEKSPDCQLSVSVTTRRPREGEIDGVSYFFITRDRFDEMVEKGELLEHAEYVGNCYGTPKAFVDRVLGEGKNVILEIEIQGAMQIRKLYPDALLVFVIPPSYEELVRRLRARGTEDEGVIAGRLSRAVHEAEGVENYDCILLNDDLDRCSDELVSLIHERKRNQLELLPLVEEIRQKLIRNTKGEL